MRLNLDPIQYSHRPFVYYAAIALLQQMCGFVLLACGFEQSKCEGISYWWRPSSSSLPQSEGTEMQEPLLFFHGIGIGLAPYLLLLYKMCGRSNFRSGSRDSQWFRRGVLLIEVPSISQSMAEFTPTPTHMVRVVQSIAKQKDISRFGSVVGHSFGSIPVAWLVQKAPHLVGSACLMDPVCFLLFEPDVAYNFIYRKPQTIVARLINILASRELYTANALFTHFWWYSNVLWFDEISCPALVVLSGSDDIVNAAKVYDYLTVSSREKKPASPGLCEFGEDRSSSGGGNGNSRSSSSRFAVALQTETRHHSHGSSSSFTTTTTATTTVFGADSAEDAAVVAASTTASAAAAQAAAVVSSLPSSTEQNQNRTRITQLNVSSGRDPATSTIWFHDMHHAQILFRPDLQDRVIGQMRAMEDHIMKYL